MAGRHENDLIRHAAWQALAGVAWLAGKKAWANNEKAEEKAPVTDRLKTIHGLPFLHPGVAGKQLVA